MVIDYPFFVFTESLRIVAYHWFSIPIPEVSIAKLQIPSRVIVSLRGSNGLSLQDDKIRIRPVIRGKRFLYIF
jgi:hypothetical protein